MPLRTDDSAPSAGDELILYQAILGSWPLTLRSDDQPALEDYAKRLWQWQQKPCAKPNCKAAGAPPNDTYEQATEAFSQRLLLSPKARHCARRWVRPLRRSPPPAHSTDWRKPCCE